MSSLSAKTSNSNSFLDRLTIRKRLILMVSASSLIILTLISVVFTIKLYNSFYAARESQMKIATDNMAQTISYYSDKVKKGELTDSEAKKQVVNIINKTRFFDKRGYFFVYDLNGICVTVPIKPAITGKNRLESKDSKGFFYIKGLIDIAKTKDSGFLKWYFFKKEGDKVDYPKLGYVKAIKEWNWFIGTGDYIDDIDNQVIQAVSLPIIFSILIYIVIVIISILTIAKSIIKPIEDMADISDQLANNDFTIDIKEDNNNTEIGKLNRSFKRLILNFKNMISQANQTAIKLLSESEMVNSQVKQSIEGSRQIVESLNQLAAGSEQVSNSVEKGLSNTNSINKAIQGIYSDSQEIEKLGNETENSAIKGREQVNKAVSEIENIKHTSVTTSSTIKELGELSSKIEQIVDLIKSIAGQTNLLALNAAIEAARAGEHGKGFAVVADEVKKLAAQSGSASDKITEMIKEIQHKTKLAVDNMDRGAKEVDEGVIVIKDTGIALENIVNQIKQANYKIQSVTKEIDNVAKNSDKVVLMTENIATITEETAASTEEIASITEEQSASLDEVHSSFESLDEVAKNLQKLISQFKV